MLRHHCILGGPQQRGTKSEVKTYPRGHHDAPRTLAFSGMLGGGGGDASERPGGLAGRHRRRAEPLEPNRPRRTAAEGTAGSFRPAVSPKHCRKIDLVRFVRTDCCLRLLKEMRACVAKGGMTWVNSGGRKPTTCYFYASTCRLCCHLVSSSPFLAQCVTLFPSNSSRHSKEHTQFTHRKSDTTIIMADLAHCP